MKSVLTDSTRAGANVEMGRTSDIDEGDAIDLNVGPEAVVNVDVGQRWLSLTIYVDIHTRSIQHEENVLENLYELDAQVAVALLADPSLGLPDVVHQIVYAGAETMQTEAGGDRLGSRRLLWEVQYRVVYANPAT